MPDYLVTWNIDIEAESAEEAARKALTIQHDYESTATYFTVVLKRKGFRISEFFKFLVR